MEGAETAAPSEAGPRTSTRSSTAVVRPRIATAPRETAVLMALLVWRIPVMPVFMAATCDLVEEVSRRTAVMRFPNATMRFLFASSISSMRSSKRFSIRARVQAHRCALRDPPPPNAVVAGGVAVSSTAAAAARAATAAPSSSMGAVAAGSLEGICDGVVAAATGMSSVDAVTGAVDHTPAGILAGAPDDGGVVELNGPPTPTDGEEVAAGVVGAPAVAVEGAEAACSARARAGGRPAAPRARATSAAF